MIKAYIRLIQRLNQLAGIFCGVLIVYMAGHILLEIGLRAFSHSTYVLDEFVGYAIATMTFMGLGYALERGALIQVSLLTDRLPERFHYLIDLVVSGASGAVFTWLAWYWSLNVTRSYKRGVTSDSLADTPLWIPESLVLVGMILLCLTLLARILSLIVYRQPPQTVSTVQFMEE